MPTTITESLVVRRPLDVVAGVATDPDVVLPIMGGLGRFELITSNDDGTEEWDVFIDINAIHVGGRVVVDAPTKTRLTWHAVRGTRHSMVLDVDEDPNGSRLTISMSLELAGAVTGRIAEFLARGVMRRHLQAGLHQLRHHLEFEVT